MQNTSRTWRKSSHSGQNGEECVEVATDAPLVRDSKNAHSPELTFSTNEWAKFTRRIKQGHLDLA